MDGSYRFGRVLKEFVIGSANAMDQQQDMPFFAHKKKKQLHMACQSSRNWI